MSISIVARTVTPSANIGRDLMPTIAVHHPNRL
jgi:hypothetical protein